MQGEEELAQLHFSDLQYQQTIRMLEMMQLQMAAMGGPMGPGGQNGQNGQNGGGGGESPGMSPTVMPFIEGNGAPAPGPRNAGPNRPEGAPRPGAQGQGTEQFI